MECLSTSLLECCKELGSTRCCTKFYTYCPDEQHLTGKRDDTADTDELCLEQSYRYCTDGDMAGGQLLIPFITISGLLSHT